MKVITVVGTSLFENNSIDLKECDFTGQSFSEWENYEDEIEDLKIDKFDSAEITVAKKLKENYGNNLEVILFTSDTIESVLAGEFIAKFLQDNNIKVIFEKSYDKSVVKDLQIDIDKIETGVNNLISKIIELHKKNDKYDFSETIFNITGGYKPLITYLSILAQITNSKIVYAFKDTKEILDIPQLPISFDDKIADLYISYLDKDNLSLINENKEIKEKLQSYGFININNKITLTPLGKFFKEHMKHKKTYLGLIIEFLTADMFMMEGITPLKGKTYEYYENDSHKIGEIDLIIEKDDEIEFFEIKSIGAYKEKQLIRHIEELIVKESTSKKRILTILFYLLEEKLLNKKKTSFKRIEEIAKKNNIEFQVKYIIIQPDKFQEFVRKFKENEILSFNYND